MMAVDTASRVFDDMARTEARPKRDAEPLFGYYNSSARACIARVRALLESWFDLFPTQGRRDLRARLRSADDLSFQSALFELYLHQLVLGMGYRAELHPEVPGSRNHPDFLVKDDDAPLFYLEGTLAASSRDEQAAANRAAVVYNTLNEMDAPNFFLSVDVHGAPASSPPGARLRHDLEKWLAGLDPDEAGRSYRETGFDALPTFSWSHDGWRLDFQPIPKSLGCRGRPGVRPIGARTWSGWVESHPAIRRAVITKSGKYKNLQLPLVAAVDVRDESADEIDVMNALVGEECWTIIHSRDGTHSEPQEARKPNGAWLGPNGPQHRRVSAVLIAHHLNPWRIGEPPLLVHHPWAFQPLDPELWPLRQWVPDNAVGRYQTRPGRTPTDLLGLPHPWPPERD
jgi:hypothetical protein